MKSLPTKKKSFKTLNSFVTKIILLLASISISGLSCSDVGKAVL